MRHGRISTTTARRLRLRGSGDAGLSARRRAARGRRSAIAGRSASRRRASCIPTSSRPIGAAASTSSRACSGPTSWPTSSATCTTSWTACRPSAARRSTPRAGRRWARTARRPNLLWSKPLGRSVRRHQARQRPPSGEDVRARRRRRMRRRRSSTSSWARCNSPRPRLRVYGHPELLAVAAAINGADFTPFNEAMFIKEPGRGASVAWHQDGTTHWDSPDWDQGIHGFNFMAQLYGCTAANGVWVVPGSHKRGQGRHQGDGRRGRQRAAARRGADDLPAGRRRHHQPPGAARLLRQHQPGLAGDGQFRLPSPQVGAGRAGRRRAQRGRGLRRRAHRASAPA